jgi:hypothetical protein
VKVKLLRRWGPHSAGQTVEVDDVQGRWLVQHNFGEADKVASPKQQPAAEGAHGADPLAGGDATRRRPSIPRPTRDASVNRAAPGEGVPPTYRAGYQAEATPPAGQEQETGAEAKSRGRRKTSTS